MKYSVFIVNDFTNINFLKSLEKINEGYLIFYAKKQKQFNHLYSAKTKKKISTNIRRGYYIKDSQQFQYLDKLQINTFKQIRRKDFQIIIKELKHNQIISSNLFLLTTIDSGLLLTIYSKETIQNIFLSFDEKKRKNFIKEFYNLYNESLSSITKNTNSTDKIFNKIKDKYKILNRIKWLSNHYNYLFLSSTSFHFLAGINYFLDKSFINTNIKFNITQPKKEKLNKNKNLYLPLQNKLRRVLVISNLSGSHLEYIHHNIDFFNDGIQGYSWKHIFGKLSYEKIDHLLNNEMNKYDLVIYRGHSHIENGYITLPLQDKIFILNHKYFKNYIHLGCLEFKNKEEDIQYYPFEKGILPISILPDNDYSLFIESILSELKINNSFFNCYQKTIGKNNYWKQLFLFFSI